MSRVLGLTLLAALAGPAFAAEPDPVVFGPPDAKLPDGAKFRVGRPTDFATTVLTFSSDGKTLAAITNRGYTGGIKAPVELWNVETGAHLRTLDYHTTGVMAAAFSPDGATIATSGIDNRLRFWDGKTGKDITQAKDIDLTGHGYALCFSPDGKRLLVGSTKLELYDVAAQKPVKKDYFAETAANQFFHTATWSPKGKYVAAACDGAGLRIWEAATGNLVHKIDVQYTPNRTRFAFSADDKLLLASTWPKEQFKMFEVESGKEQSVVKPPQGEVPSEFVQFAREMGRVAWVVQKQQYQPGRAVAISDATGAELKRFDLPTGSMSLLLSNDGKRLAVGGMDGSLRVYESETGKLEHTMLGAWSAVFRSTYASGGKVLRTVHFTGTVHDFDADTGKHLKERTLALKGEIPVTVSDDGKYLATATEAGAFTIWNLDTGEAGAKPKATLFVYREPGVGGFGRPLPLPPGPGPVPPAPPRRPLPKDNDGAAGLPPPPPVAQPAPPVAPGRFPPPPIERQPGPPQFFAAFSADGKLFVAVTGKEEGTVTVFDAATGEEKHSVKSPKGATAVALAPDGAHVFVGYGRPVADAAPPPADGKVPAQVAVRRFELKSGKEVQSWKAAPGEKREGRQHSRTEVAALHPLADKETLVVVEAQVYEFWPPPPGAPGVAPGGARRPPPFGNPGQRFNSVRVINLAGREKDRTLDAGNGPLALGVDGKSVGLVSFDMSDPNKPATKLKVTDAAGKAKSLTLSTGHLHGVIDTQRGVGFRPGGKDIAVRTGDGTVLVVDASKLK